MDSDAVRQRWARRSGEYSPDYYAYYGPNETSELIRTRLDADLDRDAAILELGCSCGRHLAHLHEHGYDDLHGVDINDDAFEVLAETYPDLSERGTFYEEAIESAVTDFEDGRFDAVFSVETLQHIHPDDEWVFAELARITDGSLITVENEGEREGEGDRERGEVDVNYVDDGLPLYYRDWNRVFTDLGFVEVASRPVGNDTLRAFRPGGD